VYVFLKTMTRFKPVSHARAGASRWSSADEEPEKSDRSADRIICRCPVQIKTGGRELTAELVNIGLAGAFLSCHEPLPVGHVFQIVIARSLETPVVLNAEVTWNNANVAEQNVVNRGMGVRFLDLPENGRKAIGSLIATVNSRSIRPPGG
jgi:hypothetical protein